MDTNKAIDFSVIDGIGDEIPTVGLHTRKSSASGKPHERVQKSWLEKAEIRIFGDTEKRIDKNVRVYKAKKEQPWAEFTVKTYDERTSLSELRIIDAMKFRNTPWGTINDFTCLMLVTLDIPWVIGYEMLEKIWESEYFTSVEDNDGEAHTVAREFIVQFQKGKFKIITPKGGMPTITEIGQVYSAMGERRMKVTYVHENTGEYVRGKKVKLSTEKVDDEDLIEKYECALGRAEFGLQHAIAQTYFYLWKDGRLDMRDREGNIICKCPRETAEKLALIEIKKRLKAQPVNPTQLWGFCNTERRVINLALTKYPVDKPKRSKKGSKGGCGGAVSPNAESKVVREIGNKEDVMRGRNVEQRKDRLVHQCLAELIKFANSVSTR